MYIPVLTQRLQKGSPKVIKMAKKVIKKWSKSLSANVPFSPPKKMTDFGHFWVIFGTFGGHFWTPFLTGPGPLLDIQVTLTMPFGPHGQKRVQKGDPKSDQKGVIFVGRGTRLKTPFFRSFSCFRPNRPFEYSIIDPK